MQKTKLINQLELIYSYFQNTKIKWKFTSNRRKMAITELYKRKKRQKPLFSIFNIFCRLPCTYFEPFSA